MRKIILASQSPRRSELMKSAGFDFEVIPAKGEEEIPVGSSPEQAVMALAKQKASEVAAFHPDCVVIGADTVVVIDNEILGKPKSEQEAFDMLRRLSGKKHRVFTGVAICGDNSDNSEISFFEATEVEFHDLSDNEINEYIKTGEPMDKAGAYGIQDKGMMLVKSINGDFYNVMGLPISRLSRILRNTANSDNADNSAKSYDISDLLAIMARLRSKNGCPWDIEQTHATIRTNVIEEAYEVAEAIDSENSEQLCEELGDLLLQVVFHAQIASESGEYDFDKVCDCICKKLIYRHPHVFGSESAETSDKVLKNWDALKSQSKGEQTAAERLESVPKLLPSLMRGERVGKRAANAGFDFNCTEEVIERLKSEITELEAAIISKNEVQTEEELGDILFTCCNLGRFLKKDCEKALTISLNKFIMRFRQLEKEASNIGKKLTDLNTNQLEDLWQIAKALTN